jgi:hypothetical protein
MVKLQPEPMGTHGTSALTPHGLSLLVAHCSITAFPTSISAAVASPTREIPIDVTLLAVHQLRSTAVLVAETNKDAYSRGW